MDDFSKKSVDRLANKTIHVLYVARRSQTMTDIAELNFQSVKRAGRALDPVEARRRKLIAALDEQKLVLTAKLAGEVHTKTRRKWMTNAEGERVQVSVERRVRAWFFEQDGGWYVQCRYGARVLLVDGENNAVFVDALEDVELVLDAFQAAAAEGKLDNAIAEVAERKRRSQ